MCLQYFKKVEYWIEKCPDKMAIVDGPDSGLSYIELDSIAKRIANYLVTSHIGKEDFVMINLPRGKEAVAVMFGVWKAGAAFVVCEEDYPKERIEYIYKDCACKLVINKKVYEDALKCDPIKAEAKTGLHDAAYAVYTSGSQGNPKGIIHEYGNIDDTWKSCVIDGESFIGKDDIYAIMSPMNFVAMNIAIISTTANGGTLYIVPNDIKNNPEKVIVSYEKLGVTSCFMVPPMMGVYKKFNSQMKKVVLSGAIAKNVWVDGISLINAHGMSETAFFSSSFLIDKLYDNAPIGRPQWGNKVRVEDGQLVIENRYVRGYINLPDLNEKQFKDGWFYTGDGASIDSDGNITITGRLDDMVKIAGNRVEPVEVENVIRASLEIEDVLIRAYDDIGHPYLVMYYVAEDDINIEETRTILKEKLPSYMIPALMVRVDKMPLLPNGKIDSRALPNNYVELGGDSLTALIISVADSANVCESKISRAPAEEYSVYMCDYQEKNPDSTLFNVSILYEIPNGTDVDRLVKAFDDVCQAHPMLHSIFEKSENGWDIVFCPEKANSVEIIEVGELELNSLVKPFELGECVYRCKIIKANDYTYLFMDFFHGAIDGTGQKILHRDLGRAYSGEKLERDNYFECRHELEEVKKSDKYALDRDFLEAKYGNGDYAGIPMPDSYENGDFRVCEFAVPEEVVYTNETSLKAVLKAMAEYNGCDKVMATWTYSGRDNKAKNDCVGLFIRDIPVGISEDEDIKESLAEGLLHKEYQWTLTDNNGVLYTTFQGKLHEFEGIPGIECKSIDLPFDTHEKAENPMDMEFLDDSRGRRFTIRYDSGMYRPESIEKFGRMVQSWYKKGSIN